MNSVTRGMEVVLVRQRRGSRRLAQKRAQIAAEVGCSKVCKKRGWRSVEVHLSDEYPGRPKRGFRRSERDPFLFE